MDSLASTFQRYNVGSFADVLGVLVAVVGFLYTIRNVIRTRQAAERVGEQIGRFNLVAELATAVAALQEIISFQREQLWQHALNRYASLKGSLIAIESSLPEWAAKTADIPGAITIINRLQDKVERIHSGQDMNAKIPSLNKPLNDQVDRLNRVLAELRKSRMGE